MTELSIFIDESCSATHSASIKQLGDFNNYLSSKTKRRGNTLACLEPSGFPSGKVFIAWHVAFGKHLSDIVVHLLRLNAKHCSISDVPLFVREFKQDRVLGAAAADTYLGTARHMSHEGSHPINVTWQLDRPIPAKHLKTTNKLVVG